MAQMKLVNGKYTGSFDCDNRIVVLGGEGAKCIPQLNTAGLTLCVPKGVVVEQPLKITYTTTELSKDVRDIAVAIILESGARLAVSEEFNCEGINGEVGEKSDDSYSYCNNLSLTYYLEEGAFLKVKRTQQEDLSAWHYSHSLVYQHASSFFQLVSINTGGSKMRDETVNILDGDGAESKIYGLNVADTSIVGANMIKASQRFENVLFIDHKKSHCSSVQNIKGIYDGYSSGSFNATISIRENTKGNLASQSNKNLMLSNTAKVDMSPQLQILSEDVKCQHGVAVGELNEEEIFYMRARGIPLDEAKKMQVEAFKEEILTRFGE